MTKYLFGAIIVLALLCVTMFYRGQIYQSKFKHEQEKVAIRDATIKDITKTSNTQYQADKKAILTYQKMLKECQDRPPVVENIIIQGCPQVTIEPCEAPF